MAWCSAGALERSGSPTLGQDPATLAGLAASGLAITDDALPLVVDADGIVDFSTPETSVALAALAAQARIVHVIGTTGFSAADLAKLEAASRHATVVRSGNMSLGVNLVAALVRKAAAALGESFDIEIVEMHHRSKVDAAPRARRCCSARRRRPGAASRSMSMPCVRATASPGLADPARSASRRCAAAPSSAITA